MIDASAQPSGRRRQTSARRRHPPIRLMRLLAAGLLFASVLSLGGCLAPVEDVETGDESSAPGTAGDASESTDESYGHEWYAEGPEETAYVETISAAEYRAFEAMDVVKSSYPANSEDDVAAATDALATISDSYVVMQATVPPAKYQAIHDYFLAGLQAYTTAGEIMAERDFAELEGAQLDEVEGLLQTASDEFLQMLDAIDALTLVWGSE